ncbi:hypothetical protein AX774_g4988 [Zancudomyces culisetae]|uniref:Uncharacterized protein n=1 Tax=Zancudomyces culisetae TaxID=1213189 RepID=A0A1R1PKR6_ZANCU|nr:hypothetical protein AX774_g4988 [Zancudomyces culisetae]|eukprot:OMH81555.1 hypothetical protein AX774_g4988 [Zancudomyces culisetae]
MRFIYVRSPFIPSLHTFLIYITQPLALSTLSTFNKKDNFLATFLIILLSSLALTLSLPFASKSTSRFSHLFPQRLLPPHPLLHLRFYFETCSGISFDDIHHTLFLPHLYHSLLLRLSVDLCPSCIISGIAPIFILSPESPFSLLHFMLVTNMSTPFSSKSLCAYSLSASHAPNPFKSTFCIALVFSSSKANCNFSSTFPLSLSSNDSIE